MVRGCPRKKLGGDVRPGGRLISLIRAWLATRSSRAPAACSRPSVMAASPARIESSVTTRAPCVSALERPARRTSPNILSRAAAFRLRATRRCADYLAWASGLTKQACCLQITATPRAAKLNALYKSAVVYVPWGPSPIVNTRLRDAQNDNPRPPVPRDVERIVRTQKVAAAQTRALRRP